MPRYLSLRAFVHWQQTERPPAWEAHFASNGPLVLELGCGNGEFLVRRALRHPDERHIGIDQEWASVIRVLRRATQAGTPNLRVLFADARVALERLFQPESLAHAYAFFPCPWPKSAHARHRLFARPFLRLINSRLQADADLRIVTDDAGYRDWVLAQADAETGFAVTTADVAPGLNTLYERRWRGQGQEHFHEITLRKQRHIPIPLKEDQIMITHRAKRFDPDHFKPKPERGEITVDFKEYLYDPKRRKALVRVMVVEDPLEQDTWIEITWHGGQWHIRPAWGCRMVPTAGVQLALDRIHEAVKASKAHG